VQGQDSPLQGQSVCREGRWLLWHGWFAAEGGAGGSRL